MDNAGLEVSILGLSFLILPHHYKSESGELVVQCVSRMPTVQGVDMNLEKSLTLGTLWGTHPGGWATSNAGINLMLNISQTTCSGILFDLLWNSAVSRI